MADTKNEKTSELTALDVLDKLLQILGNVSLADAKTWAQVEENARKLRAEGREGE